MGAFSFISDTVKKLFGRDEFNLDNFSRQEIVTKKKKVEHKIREFEKKAGKAEKETDKFINEAIDSGGSESKIKRAMRRAKSNKKKMNYYNNMADRLIKLSSFFDQLKFAKEGKETVAGMDELLETIPGSSLDEVKERATLALIETDSFLETIDSMETSEELTPMMEGNQQENDEVIAREVEQAIDAEILEGGEEVKKDREEVLAQIKAEL